MFRDLYKKANEDIKGDRAILDRAFLQAAQPAERKNVVFKYSFAGTAVAAAIVLGAVFANPSLFTNKIEEVKPFEKEAVMPTEEENTPIVANTANDAAVEDLAVYSEQEEHTYSKKISDAGAKAQNEDEKLSALGADDIMVMSIDEGVEAYSPEDGEILCIDEEYENATEEMMVFSLRGRASSGAEEFVTEEASEGEIVAEEAATEAEYAVKMFSYMYEKEYYAEEAKTEGFVNVTESLVEDAAEAVLRARNEYKADCDSVFVYNDIAEAMWKVSFCNDDNAGCTHVYIDSKGITQMIVYEE